MNEYCEVCKACPSSIVWYAYCPARNWQEQKGPFATLFMCSVFFLFAAEIIRMLISRSVEDFVFGYRYNHNNNNTILLQRKKKYCSGYITRFKSYEFSIFRLVKACLWENQHKRFLF